MSEVRLVSPLLDNFVLGNSISNHNGVRCFPAMRNDSDERYIVKTISIPASQVQLDALLLTGAYPNAEAAKEYFKILAKGIRSEIQVLDKLAAQRGFLPYLNHQIVPMRDAVGYDIYLLSPYKMTLARHLAHKPLTHLSAVNMGIDLCAALTICRDNGYLYVDLKPENIVLSGNQTYHIADLGFMSLDTLKYTPLPERYRSPYTAPEIVDAFSNLNMTLDTYALGLILYQVFNDNRLPVPGEPLTPPCYADEEMAQILLKAIDPDPDKRWPDPVEMGRALILYMQRNTVNDVPIGPDMSAEPAAEEEPEDAEAPAAEEVPETVEEPAVEEETEASEESAAEEAPEPSHPVGITDEDVIKATIQAAIAADQAAAAAEAGVPVSEPAEVAEEPAAEEEAEAAEEPAAEEEAEGAEESAEEVAEDAEEPAAEEEAEVAEESAAEEQAEGAEESAAEEQAEVAEESAAEEQAEDAEEPAAEEEAEDAEEPAAEEETEADWIDVLHELLPEEEADGADPDAPTLRDLLSDKEDAPAAAEADESAALSDETARILSQAQELIEHEAPAPVVAPEPIEIPMPEPIVPEKPQPEEEPEAAEEPAAEEEKTFRKIEFTEEAEEQTAAAKSEAETPAAVPEKKRSGLGKKLAKIAAVLVIVAGLSCGGFYYYQNYYLQPIDSFTVTGEGSTIQVEVSSSVDPSLLTVVRKDTYGNAQTAALVDGKATFTDLKPASQYIVTLEIAGFHELTGFTPVTYSTPSQTQVINLTAMTGTEDGSVLVNFAVEGPDIEDWILTCSSANSEPQTIPFTGHTVTVTGLTIGETYTLSIASSDDADSVIGETSIDYTVSDVVLAQNLAVQGYAGSTMTVRWDAPAGVTVPVWTARCYNESGYEQVVQVDGTTATFENISLEEGYTVEVTAQGMTQVARLFVTEDPILVTGMNAAVTPDTVTLTWNYDGEIPEGGWNVIATIDGSAETQIFNTTENSLTIFPAVPGSHYDFALQTADATSVFGGNASADLPAYEEDFNAYGMSREVIHPFTYRKPDMEEFTYRNLGLQDAATTFRPGSELALLLYSGVTPSYSDDTVTTLMVFRDANGQVAGIDAVSRRWSAMWDNGYCVFPVSHLPSVPGTYTMELYMNGAKLTPVEIQIAE